jgi:hypothetical protein
MIEDFDVDLLLVQESYPHHEHLTRHLYPNAGKQSAWEMAEKNGWGSGVFSRTGSVKLVAVPKFSGWVVGAEISGASWQTGIADPLLAFSIHAPSKGEAYWKQVNKLLDEIKKVAAGRDVVIGGDFNLTVSNWSGPERPTCKQDLTIQARLADEFGLVNCWQATNPNQPLCQTLRWTGNRTTPITATASSCRSRGMAGSSHAWYLPGTSGTASAITTRSWRASGRSGYQLASRCRCGCRCDLSRLPEPALRAAVVMTEA